MPKLHANGIDIYYEIHGDGKPLVLISGLGYGLWQWHKMVPGLAEHFRVITYDNRGAGESGKPEGPYNVAMMADDLAGLLDGLGVEKTAVLGHSMGGFIAQQFVLTRPQRVTKLILAATNFGGPNHIPITPEAMQVMSDRSGDPVELMRRGIAVATAPDFAAAQPDTVQALIDYRLSVPVPPEAYQAQMGVGMGLLSAEAAFEKKLQQVQAPTLILWGEHDKVVPPGNAELLAREIPNSTIQVLPDCGHIFPLEKPEAANTAVVAFLEGEQWTK